MKKHLLITETILHVVLLITGLVSVCWLQFLPFIAAVLAQWISWAIHFANKNRDTHRRRKYAFAWLITFVWYALVIYLGDVIPRPAERSFGDGYTAGSHWFEVFTFLLSPFWIIGLMIYYIMLLNHVEVREE